MATDTPKDKDKVYKNRIQQMQDIFRLSSIALILIVWMIVGFIAHQNRLLREKISQNRIVPTSKTLNHITPTPIKRITPAPLPTIKAKGN